MIIKPLILFINNVKLLQDMACMPLSWQIRMNLSCVKSNLNKGQFEFDYLKCPTQASCRRDE